MRTVTIRKMHAEDAQAFLEVHHAAVRGLAAKDYPPAVIEAWAPLPLTEEAIARIRANPDREFRLVAEIDGRIVGLAVLVVEQSELRACYVAPEASRRAWDQRWCARSSRLPWSRDGPFWSWSRH